MKAEETISQNSNTPAPVKDSLRKVYTAHNQQIPSQLSYQSIKLANFVELELADLWDGLQQINSDNYKNQLKESLSRSYNVFHEMKKLYSDLGMNFLYSQTKKLISSYGVIFVQLIEKLEAYEKNQQKLVNMKQVADQKSVSVKQQSKYLKENNQQSKSKKLGGVHLYNQSYGRCLDYNIHQFRNLRQKMQSKEKSEEELLLLKAEQQKKFRKQIEAQLNDFSYQKVDGQQLYLFLNKYKKFNEPITTVSLQKQLEKIAVFFRESQHQALQFLRKQKNLESFHELTQGFNLIVSDYQTTKHNQMQAIKEKTKQILSMIERKKNEHLQMLNKKQRQIEQLRQSLKNKKIETSQNETQTYYNFDEEIKILYRKLITTQLMNEQLKIYVTKNNEEQRKEKNNLIQQLSNKQSNIRLLKDTIEEKNTLIYKHERKIKILGENNRNKNIKDPLEYFKTLDEQMKKYFVEELRQLGFISHKGEDKHSSFRRNKHNRNQQKVNTPDSKQAGQAQYESNSRQNSRRQSIFLKKGQSIFHSTKQVDNNIISGGYLQVPQKMSNPSTIMSDYNIESSKITEGQKVADNAKNNQKEKKKERQLSSYKSKKIIPVRVGPMQLSQQKVRVFDIQEPKGLGYSQKYVQIENQKNAQQSKVETDDKQRKSIGKGNDKHKRQRKKQKTKIRQEQQSQIKRNRVTIKQEQKTDQVVENDEQSKVNAERFEQKQENISQNNNQQYEKQKIKWRNSDKKQKNLSTSFHSRVSKQSKKSFSNSKKQRQQRGSVQFQKQQASSRRSHEKKNEKKVCKRTSISRRPSYQMNLVKNMITENEQAVIISKKKHRKQCSIIHSFNLTINTPLSLSEKEIARTEKVSEQKIDQSYQNCQQVKEQKISQDTFKQLEANEHKKILTQKQKKEEKSISKQQIMKATTRKINYQLKENKENIVKERDEDIRKTQTRLKEKNKNSRSNLPLNPANHILQKQSLRHSTRNPQQNKLNSFASQTLSNFQRYNDNKKIKISLDKSEIKQPERTNLQEENLYKILEKQFGDEQVALVSRMTQNVQQFKNHILRLHESKCGKNCRHLQRYMEIFSKIQRNNFKAKREVFKLHVENLNEKFVGLQAEYFGLPSILPKR